MIPILEVVDPDTGLKKTISFIKKTEKFALNAQPNGTFQGAFDAHSPAEINELLDCFRRTHSGKELLREKTLNILSDELNLFAKNRVWEDGEKLDSIISNFFSKIFLIPA